MLVAEKQTRCFAPSELAGSTRLRVRRDDRSRSNRPFRIDEAKLLCVRFIGGDDDLDRAPPPSRLNSALSASKENDRSNPLTAYVRSKIGSEKVLTALNRNGWP
jgi:hypothetical protein